MADLRALVLTVARGLADHPDDVRLEETESPDERVLELSMAQDDLGRMIGREGRVSKALRPLVSVAAAKAGEPRRVDVALED